MIWAPPVKRTQIWFASFFPANNIPCYLWSRPVLQFTWLKLTRVLFGAQIEESLKAAGKSHLLTRLSYPGTGHLIEPPYMPNSRASLWSAKPKKREHPARTGRCSWHSISPRCPVRLSFTVITLWGGHPAPHAAAQEDSWGKILDFMRSTLRRWFLLHHNVSQSMQPTPMNYRD